MSECLICWADARPGRPVCERCGRDWWRDALAAGLGVLVLLGCFTFDAVTR